MPRRRPDDPPARELVRPAAVVAALLLLAGCSNGSPSLLHPQSKAAKQVEDLWWLTFAISTVVVLVVTGFILQAIRRGRAAARDERAGQSDDGIDKRAVPWGPRFIVIAGLVVSGGVLAGTFAISLRTLNGLAGTTERADLVIDVTGHNWWWEARYPNGAVTANEIHIPVRQTVEVKLATADVIHSFWVPQLNVKEDEVPGMDNRIFLRADTPGRYRGQCAEFCGLEHARMLFYVDAQPPAEFGQWLASEVAPAAAPASPTESTGRDIFLRSSCAGCHAVRGTSAVGTLGPDLTHMASRKTIAAGTLPLRRDTLADFVRDAQHAKPGSSMPPTEVPADQLPALLDYLMSLH